MLGRGTRFDRDALAKRRRTRPHQILELREQLGIELRPTSERMISIAASCDSAPL